MEQAQSAAAEQFATTAPSLPTPAAAEVPTLKSIPPATTDGPPPRAPLPAGARAALTQSPDAGLVAPSLLRQTAASGLKSPTDLAFTSDGVLFYTERAQGLYAQRPGEAAVAVFTPRDLATAGSSGMLAVAVDPEFSRNRFVYVFMRASAEGLTSSRVVRLTMDGSQTKVLDRRDIVMVASDSAVESTRSSEPHFGGALRFGPDGYLYVGLGDGRSATTPQSPQMLAGKVLRVDRNGQAAPGNRAPAGYDSRVFAYGVRDPVALAFHPNTEALLVAQRRGTQPDDIALAEAGTNGGWDPRCMPPRTGYCERAEDQASAASLVAAAWRGGKAGEGLTAVERLRDPVWRGWRNAFVVAFDRAQRLDLVKLDADGRVVQATPVLQKLGVGFKAVAQGPDGLYVVTSGKPGGEEIWRLLAL
jgi:glucose/arabinose dehydrogenase